ncbi:MAG: ATP-binding cassette domain-containing protein, partial [Eubacteriales bacterium]
MKEPIISFRDFGFRYKEQKNPTLFDINLDIYPGEKILILGASGCGKSTLCNCINGLIPFSYEGEITGSCTVKVTTCNGKKAKCKVKVLKKPTKV